VKIVRFRAASKTQYGVLEGNQVVEYAGTPYGTFKEARKRHPLRQTVLLAPVVPSKIVAVGFNYRDRAEGMDFAIPVEPVVFLKPPPRCAGPTIPVPNPGRAGGLRG